MEGNTTSYREPGRTLALRNIDEQIDEEVQKQYPEAKDKSQTIQADMIAALEGHQDSKKLSVNRAVTFE